mmetsp:Transcript_1610/g.3331  ORF Transcript_1610/g.3331 Transcript_1610/m.3331 type:complete len:86 (+) Transcript_1610:29-286(+)
MLAQAFDGLMDVQGLRAQMRLALEEACRSGLLTTLIAEAVGWDGEAKDGGSTAMVYIQQPLQLHLELDQKVREERASWREARSIP